MKDSNKDDKNNKITISKRTIILSLVVIVSISVLLIMSGPLSSSLLSSLSPVKIKQVRAQQQPSSRPQQPTSRSQQPSSSSSSPSSSTSTITAPSSFSAPSQSSTAASPSSPTVTSSPSSSAAFRACALGGFVSCPIPAQREQQRECANEALAEETSGFKDCQTEENAAKPFCIAGVLAVFCLQMRHCQTTCECPSPTRECNNDCVDISTNTNCGACGNDCSVQPNPTGSTCQITGSTIACQCPTGQQPCGNPAQCVDTSTFTTNSNCGACGVTCTGGQTCTSTGQGYSCQCPKGQVFFTGLNKCVPECTGDLVRDQNTGECVCPTLPGGTLSQCGDKCVDLSTDNSNCGACNHVCPARSTCQSSSCQCTDPNEELVNINGQEQCATKCPSGATRDSSGTCRCSDPVTQQVCGATATDPGTCTDITTANNCGACGVVCQIVTPGPQPSCVRDPISSTYSCSPCPQGQHQEGCGVTGAVSCIDQNCHLVPDETGRNCKTVCFPTSL